MLVVMYRDLLIEIFLGANSSVSRITIQTCQSNQYDQSPLMLI